jgi:hypothetical protein
MTTAPVVTRHDDLPGGLPAFWHDDGGRLHVHVRDDLPEPLVQHFVSLALAGVAAA